MMDLTTRYLGLDLPHPLIAGAGPLSASLDAVRELEDAGAAAIVLPSLFEEQLVAEELGTREAIDRPAESFAEARSYFPDPRGFRLGPDEYLEHLRKVKESVAVPVIASLNGVTPGGWLRYAQQMVSAGADALELNVYYLAANPAEASAEIEQRTIELIGTVKKLVPARLAVKLSPYYTALPHFAARLCAAGADSLVLFNRFYQPNLDIEALEVARELQLSDSAELLPRLRWLAILSGRVPGSLAVTGGVHTATDALKAVMAGAHAVQMVSALLRHGPRHLGRVRDEMDAWLQAHDYASLAQARGSLDLSRTPDPSAYERANYVQMLQGWRGR